MHHRETNEAEEAGLGHGWCARAQTRGCKCKMHGSTSLSAPPVDRRKPARRTGAHARGAAHGVHAYTYVELA